MTAPAASTLDLARDLADGAVSAVEVATYRLRLIEERDGLLGAFVALDADAALRAAAACDELLRRGGPVGPLHGVPIAVKDLIDVAGQVTTAGSRVPADPPAARDATVVARARAAGAVVRGRTHTHEFAWGMTTQHASLGGTRNPLDPARVPGGSAAVVAAGFAPLAELGGAVEALAAIQAHEAVTWHRATGRWPDHADKYGADVRARLERGERVGAETVERAQRQPARLTAATARLLGRYGAVLMPVAGAAPSLVETADQVELTSGETVPLRSAVLPYTGWANLCGLPATAVPVGRIGALSAGLQIVGASGTDGRVLDLAAHLTQLCVPDEEIDVHHAP